MNCYISILIIILLLLGLIRIISQKQETFIDTGARHVKLNQSDGVEYVDRMPPAWRGEGPCSVYPCPSIFENDAVCWKCHWREAEPQNE